MYCQNMSSSHFLSLPCSLYGYLSLDTIISHVVRLIKNTLSSTVCDNCILCLINIVETDTHSIETILKCNFVNIILDLDKVSILDDREL